MNLVKEFLLLKAKVDKLYCQLIAKSPDEQDPTVPNHVKTIKQEDIDNWNNIKEEEVQITEDTAFAQIGQSQKDFNKSVSDYKTNSDLKNQEQDDRLTAIEGDNTAQYDLINDLNSELDSERARNDAQDSILNNLEGINYVWSPTNRTLTLFDRGGNQLSQVSLVSLDNEGTDIRYNASTLSLELYNADNELLDSIPVSSFIGSVGTQLQLNSNQLQLKDSQGNILSTVSFSIVNIQGLQTALDSRLNKGSYPGNASDLKNEIDGKLNKPSLISDGNVPSWNSTVENFVAGAITNTSDGKIGVAKPSPEERLDVNGNVKSNSYKFTLQPTITPQPNMLIAKTDGSGLIWYNNSSVAGELFTGTPFVYNVPSTITVNHINAPASPDVPSYIQAIQDRITQLSQPGVVMQRFTNWTVKTFNNTVSTTNVENNTNIYTNTAVFNTNSSIITNTEVLSVHTNKILPKSADWVILFNIKLASDGAGNGTAPKTNRLMGIHSSETGTLIIPSLYLFDSAYVYSTHNLAILKNGGGSKLITTNGGTTTSDIIFGAVADSIIPAMILKVGDNILVQAQYGATTISEIYSAQSLSGDDFGFCVTARKSSVGNERIGNVSNVRYYIFP